MTTSTAPRLARGLRGALTRASSSSQSSAVVARRSTVRLPLQRTRGISFLAPSSACDTTPYSKGRCVPSSRLSFPCRLYSSRADTEEDRDALVTPIETLLELRQALLDQPEGSVRDAERAREMAELDEVHRLWDEWKQIQAQIAGLRKMASEDESMASLVEEEISELQASISTLGSKLDSLILPADAVDDDGCIMEMRPGVGGQESALFVGEVARMYLRFCATQSASVDQDEAAMGDTWQVDMMSATPYDGSISNSSEPDGALKECILSVKGKGAYARLRHEAGVHRVQRIPVTQNLGKLQSSTIAIVVLPDGGDADKQSSKKDDVVDPKDVKTEVMRSRGAGGQHVNKTESAIRLTHEPTGITVSMQDSRSQHQNRTKAWAILRARLLDRKMREDAQSNRAVRRTQVASMDRSDRVRTYNFPQDRVTDHRIGLSLNNIDGVLRGDRDAGLSQVIEALRERQRELKLQDVVEEAKARIVELRGGAEGEKGKKGK